MIVWYTFRNSMVGMVVHNIFDQQRIFRNDCLFIVGSCTIKYEGNFDVYSMCVWIRVDVFVK